ncbi:MAG: hypothetical protein IJ662_08995 [Clostridia bacterium]|nr:hypothetical protein [Clostridia bacterium]
MPTPAFPLLPGTPDDDNRDYLPEKIYHSDIVVNENGNNSQPYPPRLKEFHGVVTEDGEADTWFVYVPASYDPAKKTPLVVSLHGGLMTGWGQAIYTSWTMMAERDGFIVLFPNAHAGRVWCVEWAKWDSMEGAPDPDDLDINQSTDIRKNHDAQMILALIEKMQRDYNIDPGRIFMQGMSMGNMMTSLFARHYGHLLAGAAGSACATFPSLLFDEKGKIKNQGGPTAIWQSRPELNDVPPDPREQKDVNRKNRLYWMRINECAPTPQIKIEGENNFAFYTGKKADLVYLDIKNRDHGQSLDDAALVWDYLFSGLRREADGAIVSSPSVCPRQGDQRAFALIPGEANAWLGNRVQAMRTAPVVWQKLKYHGLNGGEKVRGEYICAPLSFLAEAFGAACDPSQDGAACVMTLPDGRTLQFARGSIACVIDGHVRAMYCEALRRNGELLVSVEWFCRYLFNWTVSACDGVWYAADHFSQLSLYMADLIRDLLTGHPVPDDFDALLP